MDSPFLRPTSPRFADVITDGALDVLATVGVDQFSIRRVARWMRVTPSRLLDVATRTRLLEIVVITFGDRWLEWAFATHGTGLPVRLPVSPDEQLGVRARMALEQLAEAERLRDKPDPWAQIEYLENQERHRLALVLGQLAPPCCTPDDSEVRAAMALVSGLRTAMAAEPTRLAADVASRVLADFASALTTHRRDCAGQAIAS